ncbi:MAG TPA: flagellar hook-associated protein FlgL [Anaerolineaceae bacterium]|nr:flagellar hook-associated protein FlgL [Anaerolineaceae bacterium]HPN52827.1 flagellar hook-associated protein FlgL [Anaerolineaceae bacterium]
MRVTQQMLTQGSLTHMNESLERLYALERQVASGKRFEYPSDAPAIAAQSLTIKASMSAMEAYIETGHTSQAWMESTEFASQHLADAALKAKNALLQGRNDTMGAEERAVLAQEMDGILKSAMDLVNTQHLNRYIFAGYATRTKPFEIIPAGSGVPPTTADTIQYNGDHNIMMRNISPDETIAMNVDGDAAFRPLLEALILARDALNSNDTTAMDTALADMDTAEEALTDAMTKNGARVRTLSDAMSRMDMGLLELKALLSKKEDIDMAEAVSNLKMQENAYQIVLQVSGRMSSMMNLFDKI